MTRKSTIGAALCAAGMFVLALTGMATAQNEVVYAGVVSADAAEVRAGAGKTFYTVGNLPKGTMVEVHEVIFGWFKVVPPTESFSYVSKAHVNAQGDGSRGMISFDKAPVRAAGEDLSPKDCWRTQTRLQKGQDVVILGEEDEFYKIAPPRDAYLFLPPGTVRRATAAEIAAANRPEVEEVPEVKEEPVAEEKVEKPVEKVMKEEPPKEEVVEAPAEPLVKVEPKETVVEEETPAKETTTAEETPAEPEEKVAEAEVPVEEEPVSVEAAPKVATDATRGPQPLKVPQASSEVVRALEQEWKAVETLPLTQQPINAILPRYQALAGQEDIPFGDRRLVDLRIRQLTQNKKRADSIRSLLEAKIALDEKPEIEIPKVDRSEGYAAIGQLRASGVYNGKNLPKLFRLVDPATERTIAYVRPTTEVNTGETLGQIVGVFGETTYDRSLKLRIINVEEIDLLEPRGEKKRQGGIAQPTPEKALESTTEVPTDGSE